MILKQICLKHIWVLIILFFCGCKKNIDPSFDESAYPKEIEKIFVNKCATVGCHNNNSYQNAASLNLSAWDDLIKGGSTGSVIIPFAVAQSSLFQFINTYSDIGLSANPTMPLNAPILNKEEVLLVQNWIIKGCPNSEGEIPFQKKYYNRKKAYISNQGCDIVSVIDADAKLVMRYIPVGHDSIGLELPHCLRTTSDGKFWFVCFTNGQYFQKYDAQADTLLKEVFIGKGAWNIFKISPDNKFAYISDFSSNGQLVEVDLNTMEVINTISGVGLLNFPHGIAYSQHFDTIYVTAQYGNMIYRIIPSLVQLEIISIQKNVAPVTTHQLLDPHEIIMSPDYKKYFITCEASNEVRVMDATTDTILKVIPVGIFPLEFSISKTKQLLFVSCQEDNNTQYPTFKGTVYVIDMNTLQVVHVLQEKFYQPHALAVDDRLGYLYVASRNASLNGPAPHHISSCSNRNGYFHIIDINTWKVIKTASEVSVDPYSMDIR